MEFEIQRRFSASFLEQLPAMKVIENIRQLRGDLAPVELVQIDETAQDALTATIRTSRGEHWTIVLSVDENDRGRLVGFFVKPDGAAQAHVR
jgi:hypothetical protein